MKGDPQVLLQPGKTMSLKMDYSGLKIKGVPAMDYLKSLGEDHVRDFQRDNKEAEELFIARWNHEKEKFVRIIDTTPVDLKMRIHIKEMDLGSAGKANWTLSKRGGGIVLSGRIYVKDANDKDLLSIIFQDYKAIKGTSYNVENGELVNKPFKLNS